MNFSSSSSLKSLPLPFTFHDLQKPSISHERPRAFGRGQVEGLASVTHDHAESFALDLAMLPLKLLESRLQVHTLFL